MDTIASQITSLTIVYPIVYSGTDKRKHQSSASLAFVRGIHRRPVNSPHKWPITRKMVPFDDVIMIHWAMSCRCGITDNISCCQKMLNTEHIAITSEYNKPVWKLSDRIWFTIFNYLRTWQRCVYQLNPSRNTVRMGYSNFMNQGSALPTLKTCNKKLLANILVMIGWC